MEKKKDFAYFKETESGTEWLDGPLITGNQQIFNPPEELILNEGWTKYEIEEPHLYTGSEAITERKDVISFKEKYPKFKTIIKPVRNSTVYHYTTWETLFRGILNKDNVSNNIAVLRAYSINYMNDETEGKLLRDEFGKNYLKDLVEKYGESIKQSHHYQFTLRVYNKPNPRNQKTFSVSFSKESDSLPMWNYYGYDGKGICIGFDSEEIWNQGYELYDCIYNKDIIESLGKCTFEEFNTYFFSLLAKDSHFAYEKECRIFMSTVNPDTYVRTRRDIFSPVLYDMKGGYIVPYINIILPFSAIKEIVIGPTNNLQRAEDSLRGWINSLNLGCKIKILMSNAPLAK